ncbi:MAG: right-handed parallel beta-helix repeat-containing protein [Planctomycetes bacterium]|nr:right-handed parallel beta-helix repeat-containing protein [Planctomycetota bacterium]
MLSALAVAQTPISGPLSGTLAAGVYIAGSISVPPGQTLTCAPGVIVKFAGAQQFVVSGTLICNGTVGNPVIFTDDADDSAGGDTNNNGPSVGVPGAWYDIVFASTAAASVLNHTEVRFAGTAGYSAIDLQGADIVLQDCTVRDCAARAFDLSGNSYPTITGCSVVNNAGNAIDFVPIHAVPGLTNNTASGNALDALRITTGAITSNLTLGLSSMLDGAFLVTTSVSVAQGVTLTLPAGAIVKWVGNQQLVVAGTLDCQGTAQDPVIFTDDTDDSAGGDTNRDGASTGTPGAWYDAVFTSTAAASTLAFTEVRFAGTAGYSAIDLQGADVALQNCTVRDCAARGIDLSANSHPTITDCTVVDNAGNAIDHVRLDALPGLCNNTCSGNRIDCVRITSATVDVPLTIGTESMPAGALVLATGLNVTVTGDLTVQQGVVFKIEGAQQLVFTGPTRLLGTAYEPIVFTDDADDSIAGDTDKNGPSTGVRGAWYDLVFPPAAAARTVENVVVRFAGTAGYDAVDVRDSNVRLRAVRVDHAGARGFRLQNVGPAPVNLVAWDCGSDGIWLQGGSFDLWHATVAGNGGDGIEALAAWNGTIVNTNSHGNAGANYAGLTAARVVRSNGGFAGTNGNLDLDPLFVDLPNGDLHLAAGSPCLGAADPTFATMTAKDFDENPRLLDHALSGLAAADIGAFERGNWRMEVVNTPRPGETVFLTMQGPAGSSFLGFGLNDGSALVPPYGVLLCGSLTTTALVFTFPIPIGQTIPLTVPNDPGLAGTIIGLQTLNFPLGNLAVGNFGPLYRPLVRP